MASSALWGRAVRRGFALVVALALGLTAGCGGSRDASEADVPDVVGMAYQEAETEVFAVLGHDAVEFVKPRNQDGAEGCGRMSHFDLAVLEQEAEYSEANKGWEVWLTVECPG
ncbi:MAG: hypothetical protein LBG60_00630, partial [Bifidobacteriaceae bacterium]|nr:hypothetical protein [Bifidobacteriaceae bacterium]